MLYCRRKDCHIAATVYLALPELDAVELQSILWCWLLSVLCPRQGLLFRRTTDGTRLRCFETINYQTQQ